MDKFEYHELHIFSISGIKLHRLDLEKGQKVINLTKENFPSNHSMFLFHFIGNGSSDVAKVIMLNEIK